MSAYLAGAMDAQDALAAQQAAHGAQRMVSADFARQNGGPVPGETHGSGRRGGPLPRRTRTGDAIARPRPPCVSECALWRRRGKCMVLRQDAARLALGVVVLLVHCRMAAGLSASELLNTVPVRGMLSARNRQQFYFVNVSELAGRDPALPSSVVPAPPAPTAPQSIVLSRSRVILCDRNPCRAA